MLLNTFQPSSLTVEGTRLCVYNPTSPLDPDTCCVAYTTRCCGLLCDRYLYWRLLPVRPISKSALQTPQFGKNGYEPLENDRETTLNNAVEPSLSPDTTSDTLNRRFTVAPMMDRRNQIKNN